MILQYFIPIKDFEDCYLINQLGKIWSLKRNKFLKPNIHRDGYFKISLYNNGKHKTFMLHRLIAIHFIPNPLNKKQINHINGIKKDNSISNLEWCTCHENRQHAYRTGLQKGIKGEENVNSKLTEKDVREIKYFLENKLLGCRRLAKIYPVDRKTIHKIQQGKLWKHINI